MIHNTATTIIIYDSSCFSFSFSFSFCLSHLYSLSRSCFSSLSHTHNHAVQMNAHKNVTDCETVTHTQQCFGGEKGCSFRAQEECFDLMPEINSQCKSVNHSTFKHNTNPFLFPLCQIWKCMMLGTIEVQVDKRKWITVVSYYLEALNLKS